MRTFDVTAARSIVDPFLDVHAKRWRCGAATLSSDGTQVLDYAVVPRKGKQGAELVELLRAANPPEVVAVDLG